tara:strand:+ start:1986 stop:2351 length:366 start_codon:yes stop_codon:yes gene_type:complete
MATTYTWQITNLERKTKEEDLNNVVFKVSWTFLGVDSENDPDGHPYQGSFSDTTIIGSPDPDNFTPFANITRNQCEAWVIAALAEEDPVRNEETLKAKVDLQIATNKNPPEVWGTPNSWND